MYLQIMKSRNHQIDQHRIYRTRAKIGSAYSKLTRFLDALIFEHFQNLSYILANLNVFKACLWLKYIFKIYCYALVSTIISKKEGFNVLGMLIFENFRAMLIFERPLIIARVRYSGENKHWFENKHISKMSTIQNC